MSSIVLEGASEHNLKGIHLEIPKQAMTVITGVSGSGKSSLAFDTILAESNRRFFCTLSHYSRQFLELGNRPALKKIEGLSPAIGLSQNELLPSKRANIGTVTDLGEMLGVLFAKFGQQHCPTHQVPTEGLDDAAITEYIAEQFDQELIVLCAPVVEARRGKFTKELEGFASRGYLKVLLDREVIPLAPTPEIDSKKKHTLSLCVDFIKVKSSSANRLLRSVGVSLKEGNGVIEVYKVKSSTEIDWDSRTLYSQKSGCSECGFSWPRLDSRYFNPSSLGKCPVCDGMGKFEEGEDELQETLCKACQGVGIDARLRHIRLGDYGIHDFFLMSMADLREALESLVFENHHKKAAYLFLSGEIQRALNRFVEIGLGYLQIYRKVRSLSGGELQRLRLANILGEHLRNVIYVLDEPSQGLHPLEVERIVGVLHKLKHYGNTIICVEHDEHFMRSADLIVDLGPGGGQEGGQVVAAFQPSRASEFKSISATAKEIYESNSGLGGVSNQRSGHKEADGFFSLDQVSFRNLQSISVRFPKGGLSVIGGVSGSGKSSLLTILKRMGSLSEGESCHYVGKPNGFEEVQSFAYVERKPLGGGRNSFPATYLDIFKDLRELFAKLPESQIRGLTPGALSLSQEGTRCLECKGRGLKSLEMKFLADAEMICPLCNGRRYGPIVDGITYKGLSLPDVLQLSIKDAMAEFSTHKRIVRRLEPAFELGLGYLKLGQPSPTLSGGESMRLRLAPYLAKSNLEGHLLLLDEPTSGLHNLDVDRLVAKLHQLVEKGASVVVVEHHLKLILRSDWLIELGPDSAEKGGQVVFQGSPSGLLGHRDSRLASFL